MENIIEGITNFLGGNIWFNIATFFIAVFGSICTVVFFIKGKKIKNPKYLITTNNLVRDGIKDIDSVQIAYKGNNINNLSVSRVVFWNAGKDTIQKYDVPKGFPLKVTIKDGYQILDAKIIYQKNKANAIKTYLQKDKNEVIITFDYMDYEDGFILQLFHTANSSEDILLKGSIKTVRKIDRRPTTTIITRFLRNFIHGSNAINIIRSASDWTFVITGVALMVMSILPTSILMPTPDNFSPTKLRIFSIIVGILYLYLGYSRIKREIPKGYPK